MARELIADPDDAEDLDTLIDRAVDTFFVEAPSEEELAELSSPVTRAPSAPPRAPSPPSTGLSGSTFEGPSLEEAMDSLFTSTFEQQSLRQPTVVTSGDDETDREIDLAVDTLFVEEPETPPPETAQVQVKAAESPSGAFQIPEPMPAKLVPPPREEKKRPIPPPAPPKAPVAKPPKKTPQERLSYDDVMAREIERQMHTVFKTGGPSAKEAVPAQPKPAAPSRQKEAPPVKTIEAPPVRAKEVLPPRAKEAARPPAPRTAPPAPTPRAASPTTVPSREPAPLRKLQEAILTLEWEISKRSITAVANELSRVRARFQDNVTVDFAGVSMRLVLEYVAQRMSRAHPESVRFLLEVTDYLDKSLVSSKDDPLRVFHQILTRYEKYKSVVRRAEGMTDRKPLSAQDVEINDPNAFAKMVENQALTVMRAGKALAKRLDQVDDPEDLIRSFRFLATRAFNRILESTRKDKGKKITKKKTSR